ncbi:K+/H+ antiporter subunit F [Rhodoferax sp. PAMC 29310]|uniref:K+/H+ antiporter subunit F n=1 Tax=Rhodoferax sp. PAMC 29310 TaxID=2822760 RepID=UPI001B321E23|nr:K+/H+ antiporter subunit F [Rhodoferax sp. PAMC 29310]
MTSGIFLISLNIASTAVALAMMMCAWRLVKGPDIINRILAIDTLYLNAVALVVLIGIRQQSAIMFEAALIVAMLGFAATVGLARYLTRGDVIE